MRKFLGKSLGDFLDANPLSDMIDGRIVGIPGVIGDSDGGKRVSVIFLEDYTVVSICVDGLVTEFSNEEMTEIETYELSED